MTDLTLLCITKGEPYAEHFVRNMAIDAAYLQAKFVLIIDGKTPPWMERFDPVKVRSKGYVESVLDQAVEKCETEYVLRLDDDERMTGEMFRWLAQGNYRSADHWAFPRLNLYPDAEHFIRNKPLHPDWQTRLSTKAKSGGRSTVHIGSPYGTGTIAPVALEHHKFLVRSREEREQLIDHYESIQMGAGTAYRMFSLPELYQDVLVLAPVERQKVAA